MKRWSSGTHHGRRGSSLVLTRSFVHRFVERVAAASVGPTHTSTRTCTRTTECTSVWWPWLYLRRRKRHITLNLPPLRSTPTSRSALVICDPKRDENGDHSDSHPPIFDTVLPTRGHRGHRGACSRNAKLRSWNSRVQLHGRKRPSRNFFKTSSRSVASLRRSRQNEMNFDEFFLTRWKFQAGRKCENRNIYSLKNMKMKISPSEERISKFLWENVASPRVHLSFIYFCFERDLEDREEFCDKFLSPPSVESKELNRRAEFV